MAVSGARYGDGSNSMDGRWQCGSVLWGSRQKVDCVVVPMHWCSLLLDSCVHEGLPEVCLEEA